MNLLQDVYQSHLLVRREVGVAETAFQVASAHANEYGWATCPSSLALEGIKYLVDFILIHDFLEISLMSFDSPFDESFWFRMWIH